MKNILYYFIGFNFFLSGLSGNVSKEKQELALHHFMQGEFLVDQGNYSLAVLEFQDALDIDPNAPTIHVSIAGAYLRLGKNKRAKNHLNIAVELNPDEIEAFEILGKIHLMEKSLSHAEEVYKELVRLDSMNIENYFSLANIARIEKKWDIAIDYYLQAYKINSIAIKGLEQALQICLATNKFDRAEDVCDFLLNEEPDNEKYLETLRDLALFNNDYHKALLTINKLEIIRGPSAQTLIQKSVLYEELNEVDKALEEISRAFDKDSLNIDVIDRLVNLLLNGGKLHLAQKYNQIIIEKFPDDVRGFINAGFLALNNNKPDDAIIIIEPIIEKFPSEFTIHYILGTSYYQLKDYSNSEIFFLKALDIFPGSRNTKHNLALIYDHIGNWPKSDELYLDLVSTDSTDAQAYNNYAYSLADRDQDFEFALELAKNAIRLSPNSAPYLDTIGWIYYKLNDYEKAIAFIRESLSIDSSNSVIKEHLNIIIKAKSLHNKDKGSQQAGIIDTVRTTSPFKEK
tara:strand:- start:5478 stop:7019 length:1542 start_codon:yes stop_codon:yes gene_type:complete